MSCMSEKKGKREIRYFWPDVGWLLIRFRKDGGAVLRFRPSPAAIIKGLRMAVQRQIKASSTGEYKLPPER